MLTSHKKIVDLIKNESLVIEPFNIDYQIGYFSISLRVGTQLVKIGKIPELISIEIGDPIILKPHTGISIVSLETIKMPTNLAGFINLSSRFHKYGLLMNSSFIDPGFQGKLHFELSNISSRPMKIFAGQRIVSLALFQLEQIEQPYIEKNMMQIEPFYSSLHLDQEFINLRKSIAHSSEQIKAKPKIETNLKELLHNLLVSTNVQEKGQLLENFMREILSTIKGLKILKVNARLLAEEIDIIVQNYVSGGFWKILGSPIIVECKNWTKKVPAKEISILSDKMRSISPDVNLGLLVAVNGVSGDFQTDALLKIRENRQRGLYIVTLEKEDLEEIAAGSHTSKVIETKYEKLFLI